MSKPKLLFLASEDWFVHSHFQPMLRRAHADGFEVVVAARDSGALAEERVIDLPFARGSLRPGDLWREARAVRAVLDRERPAIVHIIAMRPIAAALLSGWRSGARVFALTGRGYLALAPNIRAKVVSAAFASRLRRTLARDVRTSLLVENNADAAWVSGDVRLPRVTQLPGAGVDPDVFAPAPEPSGDIVVGVASRLIWSKGVDVAVEAVRLLRAEGHAIRLSIAGRADPENPSSIDAETLAHWREEPGVDVLGDVENIAAFWADAHIACLPTRGGEGLPRSLLEAASCARPLVTTKTPGAGDFVVEGETGLIVAPGDAQALARAIGALANDSARRQKMGAAARARVLGAYTEEHVADAVSRVWARSLAS